MEEKKFRELRADEIECRVATVSEKGCSLLLYKNARVDQALLDEMFGIFGWKREHQLIGDRLYCTISVRDPETGEWVSKQDVGTESYTEKEKGQASDSFKRAGFNWGIGRSLYTAPFIWINAGDVKIDDKNGKKTTYDRFDVKRIEYKDGNIVDLEIVNAKTHKVVYTMNGTKTKSETKPKTKTEKKTEDVPTGFPTREEMIETCKNHYSGENLNKLLGYYKVSSIEELDSTQLSVAFNTAMKGKSA